MKSRIVAALLFVLCVGGFAAWKLSPRTAPVPESRLVRPEVGNIIRGVLAVGRVEPRTRVEMKSKANGIILRLLVDVNDSVHQGQIVAELDREILEARVAEAEAKLAQAQASLERNRAEVKRLELEEKNPEFDFAERTWERIRQLFEQGVVSEDDRDLGRERFDKARHTLALVKARQVSAAADVKAAEGRLQEVQALTKLARQELTESTIRSPIDGVVLYRFLEEGDAVSSIRSAGGNASIIMTLGDLSELYVDGEVDEVDVGKIIAQQNIRPDLMAQITVESFKDRVFQGRVARITPLGLEDSNGIITFEVRIVLDNPETLLLANMTANSLIVLEEKEDVILLSQGAVLRDGEVRYALVFDPETGLETRTAIEIGISDGSQVEVASGLQVDQQVLIP